MRIISRWYVALFMIVAVLSPLAAQEDLPPSLGFALNSEDHLRYYVYDFESETITTVASAARPQGQGLTYDWGDPPPAELFLQSPYDPAVRFVLVNTMPGQEAGEGPTDWALYRVHPDGSRQLITETPSYSSAQVDSTTEWSPNGRYYYVFSGEDFFKGYGLYRLDLQTNQMTLLLERTHGIYTCQPDGVWCVVYTYEERVNNTDHTPPETLYLLDRDTGQLQELGTSATAFVHFYWLDDGSAFFYALALDQDRYRLHHYDLTTRADQPLTEWEGIRLSLGESPDKRWLMIRPTVPDGRGYDTGLYMLDMIGYTAEAFMLGEDISAISQAHMVDSRRWLDEETVIYANRSPRGELSINRADLPTREIQELITFAPKREFFDHDWSPDGRWLALSTQPTRTAPPSLYLVSMQGEIREISLPVPEDAQVCIGWFAQGVYEGGNADLCNFITHIG